ncbi:hypothetical protein JYK05_10800 [Caballeronia sp. M1242]|nr:hypothetical protein [Caballeronia sp. M1242]QSN62758.1 hypothetical protein JYK05_10800 [Caballeronia sp. M1242]
MLRPVERLWTLLVTPLRLVESDESPVDAEVERLLIPVEAETDNELKLVDRLLTRLVVVLTPVDNEFTAVDIDDTEVDIEETLVDRLNEALFQPVETEAMLDERLEDAADQPLEIELMLVERLAEDELQATDIELMPVDMELTFVDSESETELTAVESEFEKEKSCEPLIASVLTLVMLPAATLMTEWPVMSRY